MTAHIDDDAERAEKDEFRHSGLYNHRNGGDHRLAVIDSIVDVDELTDRNIDAYFAHKRVETSDDELHYEEVANKTTVNDTLAERQKTHGHFSDHATTCQAIKSVMKTSDGWDGLCAEHKEALEMITHKIARILSGDPSYKDHWHDIGGYAALGERA